PGAQARAERTGAPEGLDERLEHDRARWLRLVRDRHELTHPLCCPVGGGIVASVDLRERLAPLHFVASLREAADADGVVDHVLLRAPARAELEGGASEPERRDSGDEALLLG